MNTLTKKILLSIFTWILIFITLSTSTFAWFSMNYTVGATNLNISVKSNSTYLLIGNTADLVDNKLTLTKSTTPAYITGGDALHRVSPAFYGDGSTLGNVVTINGKWYTAYNQDRNNANNRVVNAVEISNNNLQFHLLTYKVWLTLANNSQPYNNKLKMDFIKVSGDDAVSVVVELTTRDGNDIESTEKHHLDVNNIESTTTGNIYVTKDTAYEITFYVYINGNSNNFFIFIEISLS